MALRKVDVPDQGDLAPVRAVAVALLRGARDKGEIAALTGLAPRQVDHSLHAARILGLVAHVGRRWNAAPPARGLSERDEGSFAERQWLRSLAESSKILREVAPKLFGREEPDTEVLVRRLMREAGLEQTTARHRAHALLAWRAQLLEGQEGPQLTLAIRAEADVDPGLAAQIAVHNPWWDGHPQPAFPSVRRDFTMRLLRFLSADPPLAPIAQVRGPRQVGKTVAQNQLIAALLESGVAPRRILRVQFDDHPSFRKMSRPIRSLFAWYEATVLGRTMNAAAAAGEPAFVFLDEVQNLEDWSTQLKAEVDHTTVRVVITGSSALRIARGRDSLAGRVLPIEVGPLSLPEVARIGGFGDLPTLLTNGPEPLRLEETWRAVAAHGVAHKSVRDRAFAAWSERGGFPLAHLSERTPWADVAEMLNETIRRVIQHDLRVGERGRLRDEGLLTTLFRLCCRHAGREVSLRTLAQHAGKDLDREVTTERVGEYVQLLDEALLVRQVPTLEHRTGPSPGHSKLCLVDHSLRASWLAERVSLDPDVLREDPGSADLAGYLAESVVGAYFLGLTGLEVAHRPGRERPARPEVDFVLTVGDQRIPVEVKYRGRVDRSDILGLVSILDDPGMRAPFGVLVTREDGVRVDDPRVVAISLRDLLLLR